MPTLSVAAHRSAKLEAFPSTIRTIKHICKLNHLSVRCRIEEGQAYGIEAKIGFSNERFGMAYVKREVMKELGDDFEMLWKS